MRTGLQQPIALSIIIPSFNQSEELRGLLETIETQSFRDFEILIMDGGSNESVRAVVNDFAQLPIQFVSEPDNGIYDAMNKGIDRSIGEYIYFIGCDDRLAGPDVFAKIFAKPSIFKYDYIYGNVIFSVDNSVYDGKFTMFKLMSKNVCHQAIFVKRKVFTYIGKFETKYKYLADWAFNMACFSNPGIKKSHLDIVVAFYNNGGASFNFPDHTFHQDREMLQKRFFPKFIRCVYYKKIYYLKSVDKAKHYIRRIITG